MRESERAIEREREREWESFRNRKPYLMKAPGLESTPTPLPAASESEEDRAQPDDVSSVMYLPSLTVRSSGICSSSLLSVMLWCGIPIAKLQNHDIHSGFECFNCERQMKTKIKHWFFFCCCWSSTLLTVFKVEALQLATIAISVYDGQTLCTLW